MTFVLTVPFKAFHAIRELLYFSENYLSSEQCNRVWVSIAYRALKVLTCLICDFQILRNRTVVVHSNHRLRPIR